MQRMQRGRAGAVALTILFCGVLGAAGPGCNKVKCANGTIDADEGETCDDGNETNGDGCNAQCQLEVNCGDGLIDPAEECDDGNVDAFDGCDASCLIEGDGVCGPGVPVRDANELGMMVTSPDRFIIVGTFDTNRNDFTGQCGGALNDGGNGLDIVYKYVVPGAGPVTLQVTTQNGTMCTGGPGIPNDSLFDTLVYVRSDCMNEFAELGCSDDVNTQFFNYCSYLEVPTNGGDTVYIVLDSLADANFDDAFVLDINVL